MASVRAEQSDLQSHLDRLEKAWPNADPSATYGQTMRGIAGLPGAGHVGGMTHKVQPAEPNWSIGAVSCLHGNWQNPSCLQSGEPLSWLTNDGALEHAQQSSIEAEPFDSNMSMAVPTPSATEPLWLRRLNTKYGELEQVHRHVSSAPEVATAKISRHHSVRNPQQSDSLADESIHHWFQPLIAGAMHSDCSNISPNTLRKPSIDTSDALPNYALTVDIALSTYLATITAPNGSPLMSDMASFNRSNSLKTNQARPDLASQMSLMQSFSSYGMLLEANKSDHHPNMVSGRHCGLGLSPRTGTSFLLSFGQPHHHTDHQGCHRQNDAGLASIGDASHDVYPTSASLAAMSSKGAINKVMILSADVAASDSIDLRTGEAGGQMRHMCPHPECDKHFSTSGHARRHSRIHHCLRPFECPHEGCHANFSRRDNCTQHQRAHHNSYLSLIDWATRRIDPRVKALFRQADLISSISLDARFYSFELRQRISTTYHTSTDCQRLFSYILIPSATNNKAVHAIM